MALENADARPAPSNPAGMRNDPFGDFPRDQWKRPKIIRAVFCEETGEWLVPKDADGKPIKELVSFTRASTLGGAIEYQGGLHRWKSAVVAWAIARSRTLAKRARALAGFSKRDDKDELYDIIDKAQAFAESDAKANHGTALHSLFRRIAEGESVADLLADGTLKADDADDADDVLACQAFADAITRWTVVWAERRVVCDEAQAAGKYDLIVTPKRPMPVTDKDGNVIDVIMPGDMVVVDNKTSSTADYFGEKFAVQLWIYAHGRDYDKETGERTEVGVRKDWALILHIPSEAGDNTLATWHWVNLAHGEKLVKLARDVLEGRKLGQKAITIADLDADIPAELLAAKGAERQQREELAGAIRDADVGAEPVQYQRHPDGTLKVAPAVTEHPEFCPFHDWHRGTVDCPDCLEHWKAAHGPLDGRDPEDVIAANDPADAELIEHLAAIHGPYLAELERLAAEAEQLPYDVPLPETTDQRFAREEAARRARKAEVDAQLTIYDSAATAGITAKEFDQRESSAAVDRADAETLAQRLQRTAKESAAVPDAVRARAYLVRKLGEAVTEGEVVDLWRRASRKGVWRRDDAELNDLGRQARERIAAAEKVPAG